MRWESLTLTSIVTGDSVRSASNCDSGSGRLGGWEYTIRSRSMETGVLWLSTVFYSSISIFLSENHGFSAISTYLVSLRVHTPGIIDVTVSVTVSYGRVQGLYTISHSFFGLPKPTIHTMIDTCSCQLPSAFRDGSRIQQRGCPQFLTIWRGCARLSESASGLWCSIETCEVQLGRVVQTM